MTEKSKEAETFDKGYELAKKLCEWLGQPEDAETSAIHLAALTLTLACYGRFLRSPLPMLFHSLHLADELIGLGDKQGKPQMPIQIFTPGGEA